MNTLALDASTYDGTVAVFDGTRLAGVARAAMRGRESELLMPAVDAALRVAGVAARDVHRVVCGAGPGSFTSLRIAASIAKGIAAANAIPLYEVSSLALIVAAHVTGTGHGERYLARLDALRGESYVAEFEHRDGKVTQVSPSALIPNSDVVPRPDGARVVGPGEADAWPPHVSGLSMLWESAFEAPANLAVWEPTYGRLAEAQVRWEATHGRALGR